MSSPNHAGNIIVNLAGLPEFLRKPILKKRLTEFFSMNREDKNEIINNALQAGPTIQFDKFSTLFKTWLEILCTLSEEQRSTMFSNYINEITSHPEKLIAFNLDGVFEIYMSLDIQQRVVLSVTLKSIVEKFDENAKKRLFMIIPQRAKSEIGL
ncbi:MAG: hypothetical protein KGI28_02790 [Thaumarchaeota archaeon]|nr:hypothetical protein [Nitrososphaerota archaeon]